MGHRAGFLRDWASKITLTAAMAVALTACGHPASREECTLIFDKSAELELQQQRVTDPKLVEERVAAVRAARGDELIAKCVGRRITDRAITCVKASQSDAEMDRCLQ